MPEAGLQKDDLEAGTPRAGRVAEGILRLLTRNGSAAAALGVRLGAAGLAYLLQIVLARSLGASDYGIFSFAWSLVGIGGFLATLGFGQIAVRFLAQYHHEGRHGLARGFLRAGLIATLLGSLAIVLLALALFPLIEAGYGRLYGQVLAIGLIALPFFALTDFMEGVARSQGWTIRALFPPYILRQGAVILLVLIALVAGRQLSAETAMIAALAATVSTVFVQAALLGDDLDRALPVAPPVYDLPEWRGAAMPTLLSDFALQARQNIDLIILGLLAPPAALGLYFAATRIASLLGLIDFAVGAAFGHKFARAATGMRGAGLEALYAEARRLTLGPGLLAATILVIGAPLILALFGPDFAAAVPATQILLAAGALRLAIGPVEDMLGMAGHPESVWRANAIGALVMAILCLVLTRDMQASGAALAAAAGTLASSLMLVLALRRHLGFWPFLARRDAEPQT